MDFSVDVIVCRTRRRGRSWQERGGFVLLTDEFRREGRKGSAGNDATCAAVPLASLVERRRRGRRASAGSKRERNRMAQGLLLQCGPHPIYASCSIIVVGTIHKSDLVSAHPYNTL